MELWLLSSFPIVVYSFYSFLVCPICCLFFYIYLSLNKKGGLMIQFLVVIWFKKNLPLSLSKLYCIFLALTLSRLDIISAKHFLTTLLVDFLRFLLFIFCLRIIDDSKTELSLLISLRLRRFFTSHTGLLRFTLVAIGLHFVLSFCQVLNCL